MSMSKSDDTSAFTAIELRAAGSDEGERTKPFESQDNVALARTGKKPVLKRNFGFISILAFSSMILGTWLASLNTGNWFGKGSHCWRPTSLGFNSCPDIFSKAF
ncbi:hypothetical protein N7G274_010712 [Stereocaulon virgatum]|uniref:Uncharacterized protein n=1 Tax=Stereocaulon virgatum TaxID=373712 RepID=A0ABR3ZV41_9LECA